MNCLKFTNVSLAYQKNSINVLEDINLEFFSNQTVAIIGSSGAGKSSLFKAIAKNLIFNAGAISYNGIAINQMKRLQFKKYILKIGFLHQRPNLVPTASVFANLKRDYYFEKYWIANYFKIISPKLTDRFFEVLSKLNIGNYLFHNVEELSRGQQQRVEISKLLLKKPEIILADEPTSSLDTATGSLTLKLLQELTRSLQTITLVSIHTLDLLKPEYFDYVLAIKNRRVLFYKTINDLTQTDLKLVYE